MHRPRVSVPERPLHLVWDWNGTLQDDVQAAVNGINALLLERQLPTVDLDRHRETFGFPVRNYYRALGFRLEQEDWEAMARQFHALFLADPSTTLRPAARPVLEAFRRHGIAMSLLSACEQSILENLLQTYGIREFFTQVRGLDNLHAHSKLETGRALLADLDVPAARICFVGDTDHDWEVASALGAACVLLAAGYQSPRRLARCGCPVLPSLDELPPFFGLAFPP